MNIILLFGGQSYEHEVSLVSASFILKDLLALGHTVYAIAVTKDGLWQMTDLSEQSVLAAKELPLASTTYTNVKEREAHTVWTVPSQGVWYDLLSPKQLAVDCAFPIIHGYSGEDGQIQGLLELADIPYTGCRSVASAVGMNKHIVKSILRQNNLPTTESVTIYDLLYQKNRNAYLTECIQTLNFPMIVKPSDGGSSIGIYTANSKDELDNAIQKCFNYTSIVLVEPYLHPVREIECAVIKKGNSVETFPPGEIIMPDSNIYDYDHKYEQASNNISLQIPANLDNRLAQEISQLSEKVFFAIDCEGYARIDFFLTKDNSIYINEINTIPGFTAKSMFPLIVQQRMQLPQLIQYLLDSAIENHVQASSKQP